MLFFHCCFEFSGVSKVQCITYEVVYDICMAIIYINTWCPNLGEYWELSATPNLFCLYIYHCLLFRELYLRLFCPYVYPQVVLSVIVLFLKLSACTIIILSLSQKCKCIIIHNFILLNSIEKRTELKRRQKNGVEANMHIFLQ